MAPQNKATTKDFHFSKYEIAFYSETFDRTATSEHHKNHTYFLRRNFIPVLTIHPSVMSPHTGAVSSSGRRGLLIVFEGLDRTGKTTHCKRIVQELDDKAKMMQFPDRTTVIGSLIDQYLRREKNLDDHVVHLLFSSNRWEKVAELREALNAGTHVFVDRLCIK